jgi:hypothetical protein
MEEKPYEGEADGALRERENPGERPPPRRRNRGEFPQAGCANDAVLVLRNALAAVELAAFRAACHRLAKRVMKATLMNKCGHISSPREGRRIY